MHEREHSGTGTGGVASWSLGAVRRLAFWLAIVLPVAYGPLLYVGVDDRSSFLWAGLTCLHLACLVVGHDYSPSK